MSQNVRGIVFPNGMEIPIDNIARVYLEDEGQIMVRYHHFDPKTRRAKEEKAYVRFGEERCEVLVLREPFAEGELTPVLRYAFV